MKNTKDVPGDKTEDRSAEFPVAASELIGVAFTGINDLIMMILLLC